jgi:serine/threonine protein kinase
MPSDSIAGFLDQAQANRVLFPEQVEQLIRQPDIPQNNLDSLCEYLERRGALTRFQADMLRQGRGYELNFAGYPVLDEIGPCPGGVAYRALHPSLRTPLVLHRLRGDLLAPADSSGALVNRARTAATITHPHITSPLDAGFYRDEAYVAVDAPGDSADLETLVREIGAMPTFLAAEFGRYVASALREAHARGLVHGEVRPGYVLVGPLTVKPGPDGTARRRPAPNATAKLVGLGLIPFRQPANTAPPPAEAIPFLPPERLTTGPSEPRGDLYGLGATLYYLLTTRPPYSGPSAEETLQRVRSGEPAALSALRPDAPPELVELVNRLMARRPESRPESAADVEAALGKFCRPGTAPQGSPPEAEPVAEAMPVDAEQSLVIEQIESSADWGVNTDFAAAQAESAAAPPKPKKMITHAERMRLRIWLAIGTGLWLLAGLGWMYLAGCFNTAAPEPEPTPIKEKNKEPDTPKKKRTGRA